MSTPYQILDRKRQGERLSQTEVEAAVRGATDGSWTDAQLGALLMAVATAGMSREETADLTRAMLHSGARWKLATDFPNLVDKHSTGGVGDKASLVLAPLLASAGIPVAMLTGRGLGHTGGTADKLEGIPGVDLGLSRARAVESLRSTSMAVGTATDEIAPADRKLYALRNETGTVTSIPLITASILSKKLALGATAVVYDVKTGSGAFLQREEESRQLAEMLVSTSESLGSAATAMVTDMSQPLGRWVGHNAEVNEVLDTLSGEGPQDLRDLVLELCGAVAAASGSSVGPSELGAELSSGRPLEVFLRWAEDQGAEKSWLESPRLPLAPVEIPLVAPKSGFLGGVRAQELGLLLTGVGGGRSRRGDVIDHGVALRVDCRIGDPVKVGQTLGAVFLRASDPAAADALNSCFQIAEESVSPPALVRSRV